MYEYLAEYLLDLEQEVLLRSETRMCEFRDGTKYPISAFDIVWRWYDRLVANIFSDNPYHILDLVELESRDSNITYDRALEIAVPNLVYRYKSLGFDIVDDDDDLLEVRAVQEAIQAFHARKEG